MILAQNKNYPTYLPQIKKKEGDDRQGGRKFVFQPFIWSSVGFGEDAYSRAEQFISFMIAFSRALEGMWRMEDSGMRVLICLPGLWVTCLNSI